VLDLNVLLHFLSLGVDHLRRLLVDRFGVVLEIQRNTSRLDGNATLLLISTGIRETSVSGSLLGNDTGLGHQSVGKSRLSVIDVSNHRKVTNVVRHIHHMTDLIDGKVDLGAVSTVRMRRVQTYHIRVI